jgi:hypothetical protein
MHLYQQNLDSGVKSGIDPHRDPRGFRKAAESGMRQIHLGGKDRDQAAPPAKATGSAGSAGPTGGSATSAP